MTENKSLFSAGTELGLALTAIGLGLVEIFAPLALLNISPGFASITSQAPVQFGVVIVATNQVLGIAFLLMGGGLYYLATRKRKGT